MATWAVSGAGTGGYNGTYVEDGTYATKMSYKLDATHYLWWATGFGWALSATKGADFAYYTLSADLPGTDWTTFTFGTAPAPTVTAGGGGVTTATIPLRSLLGVGV